MRDVAAYAPHVLNKITSNLRVYLEQLHVAVNQNSKPRGS